MGTTAFTLHVYSNEPVDPALGHFFSLSEGWQSMLLDSEHQDMDQCARKLSKKVSAPILVFCIYDSEEVSFGIYENGKRCAVFSSSICHTSKGIFKIPGLVGYPDGYKRRISEILSCPDIEQLTALLEEFFGVALVVYRDILEEDPESLIRARGETQYLAFHEEQKKLSGRQCSIRATLTEEIRGKIFQHPITITRNCRRRLAASLSTLLSPHSQSCSPLCESFTNHVIE